MQPNARASFSRDEEKLRNGLRWKVSCAGIASAGTLMLLPFAR